MNAEFQKALSLAGGQTGIARIVNLTPQAVQKWESNGCFPRTEWTGETNYAQMISEALHGEVVKEKLLLRPELKETPM